MPFVRSMIWDGTTMSPGRTSSRSEPTAEKATMAWQPRCLSAAMLARAGTCEGVIEWCRPCRAMKAIEMGLPPGTGRAAIVMGEEVDPQG